MIALELAIVFLLFLGSSYLYILKVQLFEDLNSKIVDSYFLLRGEKKPSDNIVIVDIDEKSLQFLGQWPWSRDVIARIIENLTAAQVGIVGLDIIFAEADNSSPSKVLKRLGLGYENVPDYDKVLATVLQHSLVIGGYMFDFQQKIQRGVEPNIAAIIIQKNFKNREYLPKAQGIISSIEVLQKSLYSSGFFNTIPDSDGIVRSTPLLVRYKENIYPSLSLEILRLVYGTNKISIDYTEAGIADITLGNISIPTDRFARLSINYYGRAKVFKYISAVDIYENKFDKKAIAGKIVLIGTSAGGLLDLRATPYESTYPGVEIHATVIENVLKGDFISHPSWIEGANISIIFIALLVMFLLFFYFGALVSAVLSTIAISVFIYISYYIFISEGIIINVIYPLGSLILLYMILSSLRYIFESQQKELVKAKFAKKVSASVAEELIRQGDKDILEVHEREVTIFFSDIRGFTSISEELSDPKILINYLNLYMTPMTDIITKNKGTVDKFIGDAIMAYWNAPLDVKQHTDKALESALKQIKELKNLNGVLQEKKLPNIDIGIGINSGLVVVGEMGSYGRSDYTIIGDNVNLASRLEGLNKVYGTNIIISEFTKEKLTQKYFLRYLDRVRVKGKQKPVRIYEVLLEEDEMAQKYSIAQEKYIHAEFHEAQVLFEELYAFKEIKLYALYIERCKYYIEEGIKDFDGVFEFQIK